MIEKMEILPEDILELFFKQLSSLKDITKCYKTCQRWRKIIEKTFINRSKFQSKQSR